MRIKIAVPHNTVTAGIELLHQVASELNKYDDVTADIWYMVGLSETEIPSEYSCYQNMVNNDIHEEDILLFPEIWAHCTNEPAFQGHKMLVYWESVDNYFSHTPQDQWFKFGDETLHISQTEYSNKFLADVIKTDNVIEITDYVHDDFLNSDIKGKRNPVVLYNPVKGLEYTEKIIQLAPDITFKPISGMVRTEIHDLMKHSMVWIDFGFFPGKDRLPREAGASGMCLITGKRGSAKFHKDMGIPEKYKIDNANYADLGEIIELIRDILDNFEDRQKQFASYRKRLKQEKEQFNAGISELVERLRNEV